MDEVIIKAEESISFDSNEKNEITQDLGACEAIVEEHKLRFD